MISDLAFKGSSIEGTKQEDEDIKQRETRQAEGDELQVMLRRPVQDAPVGAGDESTDQGQADRLTCCSFA